MVGFILVRCFQSLGSMFVVTILIFAIVHLSGDPLQNLLPVEAPLEQYAEMRALFNLDKPIYTQYRLWISAALTGDFGNSLFYRSPVSGLIANRLPNTLKLAGIAFVYTIVIGLSVGVYAAASRGSPLDLIARSVAIIGMATPSFWLGILLIMIFAVWLGVAPAGGMGGWTSMILPAIAIGSIPVAALMRLTRSSMIEVLTSEYVKMARIKGVSETWVLWKHGFRNAAIPVATYSALFFASMLQGSVVTETVFGWPGIGRLIFEGVKNRDFPIVQAVVLLASAWYILMNLLVDISYAFLNPKVKYGA